MQNVDNIQGFGLGQAAEDPSEITLRYLMGQAGQADLTDFVFDGKCGFWFIE
jgi:hypothetical protein